MSDEQSTGGVRRFGRKDRKRSLDPSGPLFPLEETPAKGISDAPDFPLDIDPPDPRTETGIIEPSDVVQTSKQMPKPKPAINRPPLISASGGKHVVANVLTFVFLLATVGVGALVMLIASNPYTPLNPFPPFTPLPIIITATFLPPTPTIEGTAIPTATFTPVAIDNTPPMVVFRFSLQPAQPIYVPNANTEGCNWSSIAGTVTNSNGAALDGYRVHISGNGLDETVFSGAALTFGAGGFELFLNGTAQEQTYIVQLLDPQQAPLSPEYNIATRATCDQNVAVLSFVEEAP